jgi:hypothetical protein
MTTTLTNIKILYYRLKYKNTLNLISLLIDKPDDEKVIAKINQTNLKDLNQDVTQFVQLRNPDYHYHDPNKKVQATVLATAMKNSSPYIILALLEKGVDIHHLNPYYQIFKRKHITRVKENEVQFEDEKLIEITQKFIDKGLDLTKPFSIKINNNKYENIRSLAKEDNYLLAAIHACPIYMGGNDYKLNPARFKHLKYLVANGLSIQDDKGEAINLAIRFNNKELLDYLLNLDIVKTQYIQKAIANCASELVMELSMINNNYSPILEKNKEMLKYTQIYLEKLNLESNLEVSVKSTEKTKRKI